MFSIVGFPLTVLVSMDSCWILINYIWLSINNGWLLINNYSFLFSAVTLIVARSLTNTHDTILPLIRLAANRMDHREPILQVGFKRRRLEEYVFHLPVFQAVGTRGIQTFKGVDTLLPPFFGSLSIIHLTQCIEYVELHVLLDLLVIFILSLIQEVVPRSELRRGSTTGWPHCSSEDSSTRFQYPYLGKRVDMVTYLSRGVRIPNSSYDTGRSPSAATAGLGR